MPSLCPCERQGSHSLHTPTPDPPSHVPYPRNVGGLSQAGGDSEGTLQLGAEPSLPSSLTRAPSPSFLSREVAGRGSPSPAVSPHTPHPTVSGAHPFPLPCCCSPWAGETLWTRRSGGPPPSASVTAEAGKLPTLSVRPFCPFQVAESGLWEEALVKAPGGGWARAHIQLASICLEEGKLFFSGTQKGSMGLVAPAGGHCDGSAALGAQWGRGEAEEPGSRSWGAAGWTRIGKVGWESSSWGHVGGMRLLPALDDGDEVTSLHP